MAEPLEELFSRYDRREPQLTPAVSTGVRMKPPVQPQERNVPTIGPASDFDASEGRPAFAAGGYVYDPERIHDIVNQIIKES